MKKKILNWLIPLLVSFIAKFIKLTSRFSYYDRHNLEKAKRLAKRGNFALAVWHQNLFSCILSLEFKILSMTSQSKDGKIAADTSKRLGIKCTRGSSSRGGKAAMQEMIEMTNQEQLNPALTVDGPRGPAKEPKRGLFKIAHDCGIPIIPYLSISTKTKTFERSWDKFRLALPFGHIHSIYGEPFMIEKLDEQHLELYSKRLRDEMERLEQEILKLL